MTKTKTTKKAVKPAKKAATKKTTKTMKGARPAAKKAVTATRGRKAVYAKKPLAAMNQAERREYWRESYRRRAARLADASK